MSFAASMPAADRRASIIGEVDQVALIESRPGYRMEDEFLSRFDTRLALPADYRADSPSRYGFTKRRWGS